MAARVPRTARVTRAAASPAPTRAAGLAAYLGRLVALDDRARGAAAGRRHRARRLGRSAAGRAHPASGRARRGAGRAARRHLSARRLLDRMDRAGWTAPTSSCPTRSPDRPGPGCSHRAAAGRSWPSVPAAAVHDAVRVAVEGFRRRVDELPEQDRQQPAGARRRSPDELWARPVRGRDPAARGARRGPRRPAVPRGRGPALEAGAWQRLACPGGSVVLRRDGAGHRARPRPGRLVAARFA